MPTYLVCSTPVHGHVSPMLTAAAHLVRRGHRVIVLTGSRFAERVAAIGAEFVALPGIADFDDRDVPSYLPDRDRYRGLAQAQYDIQTIFVKPIAEQDRALRALLWAEKPDAILVDGAFGGAVPLLLQGGDRPPVVALGVTPLTQSSRDVAPAGTALPPSSSALGRVRNRVLGVVATRILFRRTQKVAEAVLREAGVPRLEHFIMDVSSLFDRFLQLCPREFEYPRSDLAPNTEFVGGMPALPASAAAALPEWWGELDDGRPVVHVTQGTIDNADFGRLLLPTVRALDDLDVRVVASLGGRPESALEGEIPANARIASYLPYDALLPRTAVMVTNGGYGGVLQALGAGVPLVVAGGTEDKPEVAARVAWSGAGVDLRTGTPEADDIRAAVLRVLTEPSYSAAAHRLAEAGSGYDTLALIERALSDTSVRVR